MFHLVRSSHHARSLRRIHQVVLAAGLIALTPLGGCDWEIEKEQVKKDVEKAIEDWYSRSMLACAQIQDPVLKAQCLAKLNEDNTSLTREKIKLLASQVNCDEAMWKSAADVLKAILDALGKIVPTMIGLIAGIDGQVNVNAAAQLQGNQLVFLPGSQLGIAYDGGDMVFQEIHGSFAMTLDPDGQGGFIGHADSFEMDLTFFSEPTMVTLATDALPSEIVIDAQGRGVMRMHLVADNALLPKSIVYVELPIQTQPPFQFALLSTGGTVPGEQISPRFIPAPGDCNSNGVDDLEDIAGGASGDCDADGIPDECEIAGHDCNGNGIPDSCDIAEGLLHDANGNGEADECEPELPCYPDFTGDAALDLFDFLAYVNAFNAGEHRADCDMNGVLDLFDFLCFVNAFNAGC